MPHRLVKYAVALATMFYLTPSNSRGGGDEIIYLKCQGIRTVPTLSLVNAATSAEIVVDTKAGTIYVMGMALPITNQQPNGMGFQGSAAIPGYKEKGIATGWFDQYGSFFL